MHTYDVESVDVAKTRTPAGGEHDGAGEAGRVLAAGDAGKLGPAGVLHLQRSAGNASVAQLLGDDDATATATAQRSPVKDIVGQGGGSPLDDATRSDMEGRFGEDFSSVRVHTDGQAHDSARAVNAHAYTVGNDIVFAGGRYDPGSSTGQRTIAHELTHVVQQRSGPVDGTPTAGGIRLSHPSDRFEQAAEQNADRLMAAASPAPTPVAQTSIQRDADEADEPAQRMAVQREGEEEEETAQGEFVQRQEEEEETAQGMFVQREGEEEEETAQGMFVQREGEEEEETAQGLFVQRAGEEEEVAEAAAG
jgi:hypothetical protein